MGGDHIRHIHHVVVGTSDGRSRFHFGTDPRIHAAEAHHAHRDRRMGGVVEGSHLAEDEEESVDRSHHEIRSNRGDHRESARGNLEDCSLEVGRGDRSPHPEDRRHDGEGFGSGTGHGLDALPVSRGNVNKSALLEVTKLTSATHLTVEPLNSRLSSLSTAVLRSVAVSNSTKLGSSLAIGLEGEGNHVVYPLPSRSRPVSE